MAKLKLFVLLVFYFLFVYSANTQGIFKSKSEIDSSQITKKKNLILAYPVVFYQPETRLGGGVAGIFSFRFKNEPATSNPSQIQFTTAYTQNKQIILTLPFEIYTRDNGYKFKGELAYFRYFYNFFGIGNNTKLADKEQYQVNFPRLRLDMLKHLGKSFVGLRYRYDYFDIKDIKRGGLLDSQDITGKSGGRISGLGLLWQYDSRNYLYNATKGSFIETEFYVNDTWTGSDFKYQRLYLNAAKYVNLGKNITIVGHSEWELLSGNPIFYDLAHMSSPRILRGYQDRRFIDKNMVIFQTELRFPIYNRFQGVAFSGVGNVASSLSDILEGELKFSYGAGIRYIINRNDRIRIRLDYGRTLNEGGAFYLTMNDAF